MPILDLIKKLLGLIKPLLCLIIILLGLISLTATANAATYIDPFNTLNAWTKTGTGTAVITDGHLYTTVSSGADVYIAYNLCNTPASGDFDCEFDYELFDSNYGYMALAFGSQNNIIRGPGVTPGNTIGIFVASYTDGNLVFSTLNNMGRYRFTYYSANTTLVAFQNGVYIVKKSMGTAPLNGQIRFQFSGSATAHMILDNFYFDTTANPHDDVVDFKKQNETINKNIGVYKPDVQRLYPSNPSVSFQYYTQDGTAHSGVDYGYTSGTLNFTGSEVLTNISIPIYNTDPTITRNFTLRLTNIINGDPGYNQTLNVTILSLGAAAVAVDKNPALVGETVTATLTVTGATYDTITWDSDTLIWMTDSSLDRSFRKLNGGQWQQLKLSNMTWINVSSTFPFHAQTKLSSPGSTHYFKARIGYLGQYVAEGQANVTATLSNSMTEITIYIRDHYGAELLNVNATLTDIVYGGSISDVIQGSKEYMLNQSTWYRVTANLSGYSNYTHDFWSENLPQYNVWTITMISSYEPTDPAMTYLDASVEDYDTGAPLDGATVKAKNASGSISKPYTTSYPCTFTVVKNSVYTISASIQGYTTATLNYNVPGSHSAYAFKLKKVAATATAEPGATGVPTPAWTPSQRAVHNQGQTTNALQILYDNIEGLVAITVIGLMMAVFRSWNGSGGKKRSKKR